MELFDTHAHYDDERFDSDREDVLTGLPEKGIVGVINCGVDVESSRISKELAERFDFVSFAAGYHPHEARQCSEERLDEIKELLKHPKAVAIGEIGLDYHYDFSPQEVQKKWFGRQMELSEELDLPVVIHEREAAADCFDIVKSFHNRGVYHCFSGSVEMAREIVKRGYYLSFTGAVTFKNARKALEVLKWAPLDRIMIETDCPYMAPEPFRGRRNDSSYVYRVAETIADLRGLEAEEIAAITAKNAREFFGVK